MKISKKYLALGLLGSVLVSGSAYAATVGVNATIRFLTALTLTQTATMNFGQVTPDTGVLAITPAGVLTKTSGDVVIIGGTPAAAVVNITGDAASTISYQVTGFTDSANVTLSAATCSYDGGAAGDCTTGPVAGAALGAGGKNLAIGATATINSAPASGATETPSLTLTVLYT